MRGVLRLSALASYAKQADDDTLRKQADRIQARAVRRCGELLKQFDGKGGPLKTVGAPLLFLSGKLRKTQGCLKTSK